MGRVEECTHLVMVGLADTDAQSEYMGSYTREFTAYGGRPLYKQKASVCVRELTPGSTTEYVRRAAPDCCVAALDWANPVFVCGARSAAVEVREETRKCRLHVLRGEQEGVGGGRGTRVQAGLPGGRELGHRAVRHQTGMELR
jgi:hypothetical protein